MRVHNVLYKHLVYHCPHCCNANSIEIAVMAIDFYEQLVLYVLIHLIHRDKAVVLSVHFCFLWGPCGV